MKRRDIGDQSERDRPRLTVFGINYDPEPVGIGPYTTDLAHGLDARGWDVTVVTGHPHYPAWQRTSAPQLRAARPAVVRAWHHVPRRPGSIGRGLMEATWTASGLRRALRPNADVVLGVVPSLSGGLLAAIAGAARRVPFVLHVQDLVGQAVLQARSQRRLTRAVEAVEMAVARRASGIAVVSPGMADHLAGQGVERDRIVCVRNWARESRAALDRAGARAKLGWPQDRYIVVYSGSIGAKHGLDLLLDVAEAACHEGDDDILFVIRGEGGERHRLDGRLLHEPLGNTWLLPIAGREEFAATLAAADALVVYQRPEVTNMALPSKLTAYFAANRPVVAAVDANSETAREVRRSDAGIIAPPDDPRAVLAAIRALRRQPDRAAVLAGRGLRYAETALAADSAFGAFDGLLRRALTERPVALELSDEMVNIP
jgi:glycosyltransferase involved in cell wall biosynthesis